MAKDGSEIHQAVLELIDMMAEERNMCKSCACSNLAAFLIVDGVMRRCGEGEIELAASPEELTNNYMQVLPFVVEKSADIINQILERDEEDRPTVH